MKNLRKIKTTFILSILLLVLTIPLTSSTESRDPYSAFVSVDLDWANGSIDAPIAPRGEIAKLDLKVTMKIKTDPRFGAGLLEGYSTAGALIDISLVYYPSWCSAVLEQTLLMTNISPKEEAFFGMFLHVHENAPAYETGKIRLQVTVRDLGLIKGDSKIFNLTFKPAYYPIIKTELPESNTKRINPSSEAIFPIEIQNAGNAETKVQFEVLNIPKGWTATVTDSLFVGEEKGSKEMAYLIVRPSRDLGYHYGEAAISIKITPAYANDLNITGTPIFANFIIQERGFSSSGIEVYLFVFIIIIAAIVAIMFIRKKRK